QLTGPQSLNHTLALLVTETRPCESSLMGIKEIRSQDWEAFCRKITELRKEALLTVEVVRPDGRRDQIARSVPLRNMSFQKTDGCSDQILLDLESGREQPITHAIVDPIHILLRPSTNGSYNPM